jgi:hypothetical protein
VSRPRKPFGANHPGRLPATMMKVLAAEMSDPQRLRRGKQYAKDGSVLDIIVEPGRVTCEVQGSRSMPYVAVVDVTPGDGMPLRRDISTSCSCPDDDNWDDHACKHVLAAMFALSDEFLLEPELLDVWRGRAVLGADESSDDPADGPTHEADHPADEAADRAPPARRHLRLVRSPGELDEPRPTRAVPDAAPVDRLQGLLDVPAGQPLPEVPELDRVEPDLPRQPELASVLRDALANLRIDWD